MSRVACRRAVIIPVALCVCAATAFAAIISTTANLPMAGVDAQGNPSSENEGTGSGKIYKQDSNGIVVGVFSGQVINKSGASALFTNRGIAFEDPWTDERYTATTDSERVFPPNFTGFSRATLLVIYNPAADAP